MRQAASQRPHRQPCRRPQRERAGFPSWAGFAPKAIRNATSVPHPRRLRLDQQVPLLPSVLPATRDLPAVASNRWPSTLGSSAHADHSTARIPRFTSTEGIQAPFIEVRLRHAPCLAKDRHYVPSSATPATRRTFLPQPTDKPDLCASSNRRREASGAHNGGSASILPRPSSPLSVMPSLTEFEAGSRPPGPAQCE